MGFALAAVASGGWGGAVRAEPRAVHVASIEGTVDLGLAPFVARVVETAEDTGAALVVLDIDTFGGRLDAAVLIRDVLLGARVPTIAFVDKRAISAGALIALAAERIAMSSGATIGAATPVQAGNPGKAAEPVAEKTVSYVRKEFRATAEARGRPPEIAEAMVDADVAVPGVVEKGKLLTLTTAEALEAGIADLRADSLEALLAARGLGGAEVRRMAPNWAERLVRFLTHPVMTSVLMTVGILGIIVELRTPGFGVPGALGMASLALFFWGHWLVRLAGWEELLLVVSGLALLTLELFVIPGFGAAGIAGILALSGGLALSLVGAGPSWEALVWAGGRVVLALAVGIAGALALLPLLPRLPFGRGLVLAHDMPADAGFVSPPESDRDWLGKRGTAASPLRPAGLAAIEGARVDVVSDGEYIERGALVHVVRVDGNRIVVRRLADPAPD